MTYTLNFTFDNDDENGRALLAMNEIMSEEVLSISACEMLGFIMDKFRTCTDDIKTNMDAKDVVRLSRKLIEIGEALK